MAKKKNDHNLRYLNLGILAFVTAIGLELVPQEFTAFQLDEMTLQLTISTIYVLAAVFVTAFVSHVKIAMEQKYILYLVILAITFFRVMTLMREYVL